MMFSILTYNVLYNSAFTHLKDLLIKHKPDIICLQEVDTNESNLKQIERYGYRLADYSNSFFRFDKIYGIATFYSSNSFKVMNSSTMRLPRSIYELFLYIIRLLKGGNKPRTVLHTEFIHLNTKRKLAVYNTHLTLIATNQGRVKHLKKIIHFTTQDHKPISTIFTGDFNYFPYSRKLLESLMDSYGFKEATKLINYTSRLSPNGQFEKFNYFQKICSRIIQKIFSNRFKLDYMFYKKLTLIETKRIESNLSDHYPILAKFQIAR